MQTANYIMTWHTSSSLSIVDYLSDLSSSSATPGGGSVSALLGAIGFSLGNMVANLTKTQSSDVELVSDMEIITDKLYSIIQEFLILMAKDEEAFLPLSKAYHLPPETPHKDEIMEEALKTAALIPYEVLSLLGNTIDLFDEIYKKNTSLAISDVGIGVSVCKSAFESALLNVTINTKALKDKLYAKELNDKANQVAKIGITKCIRIYDRILSENLNLF
jgi:methenyltetrahydrofolate cyclohydrolase